jgi:hypothetical protein
MSKTKKTVQELTEFEETKLRAENDLEFFIELVAPKRMLGSIHREVIRWWGRQDAKSHQGLLMPRDHMKSALLGFRCAQAITKDPTLRILYISSTRNLAIKQLKFIKDILTSDRYRQYWPEMVNPEEAKREKWTEGEISVDHPRRREESIRDPSIFTAGLTSNIVGMHCDIAALDDVVTQANAYTADGREKVLDQYGHLSSIEGTGAKEWFVGTRYHDQDLYANLMERMIHTYDERGKVVEEVPLFEIFGDGEPDKISVENRGDGTGQYLWPRQQRDDGKWFGFDWDVLSKKKASYTNHSHYRAQYYNDPRDADSSPIQKNLFQYYDKAHLNSKNGRWFFKNEPLNVFAAVDFAYSTGRKADYTSIVVIGVTGANDYYILEIDRFKTTKISDYYSHILELYQVWGFRKIRAEVSVAQKVIVDDLKDNYIRKNGLSLAVEEFRPSRWQGAKEERIMATLEPRYQNRQIWHYLGGYCQTLEEELIYSNPAHDDIKDALASVIDFAVPPTNFYRIQRSNQSEQYVFNSKFGGVA